MPPAVCATVGGNQTVDGRLLHEQTSQGHLGGAGMGTARGAPATNCFTADARPLDGSDTYSGRESLVAISVLDSVGFVCATQIAVRVSEPPRRRRR